MLSYAFQAMRQEGYKNLLDESFDHANDLLAAILAKGIAVQIRKGLGREYLGKTEALSSPVGKMSITSSISMLSTRKSKLVCDFDEFCCNNTLNKILKTTILILLRNPFVKDARKKLLKILILYFSDVEAISIRHMDWYSIKYNRNNSTYEMLIKICYLVCQEMVQSEKDGHNKIANFIDEQKFHRLFEKFVLEYYKYHYPMFRIAPEYINWASDDGFISLLPSMKTDITIRTSNDDTLIIDAKFYQQILQKNALYDSNSIHSQHLYQIYSYVKNSDIAKSGKVSGILLYAKTDEVLLPDNNYMLGGNRIGVYTLDLSLKFKDIQKQLDSIIYNWHKNATNIDLVRKE